MADQMPNEDFPPESNPGQAPEKTAQPGSATDISNTRDAPGARKLTKEEQMALYEKELKENDWGHQPC